MTMKKNKKNMSESVTIYSPYEIYKDGEFVQSAMHEKDFNEDELKAVAEVLERHGGYPVEMCELQELSGELMESIYVDELNDLYPNLDDNSCLEAYLCEEMPTELIEAADKFVKYKDVDQDFYLDVDGEEVKSSFLLRISNDAFCKMKKIVTSGSYDKSDFDMLKELEPETYQEVAELVFEWAFKYSMRVYDAEKPCVLKNFPYQVYVNL